MEYHALTGLTTGQLHKLSLRVRSDNLNTMELNLRGAHSRIMDADLASEQLNSAKLSILQQTATAQLAAANSAPASILALFR